MYIKNRKPKIIKRIFIFLYYSKIYALFYAILLYFIKYRMLLIFGCIVLLREK